MRNFRLGDHVRPKKGTRVWMEGLALHEQWGKVTALPSDGTTMARITVSYPDGTTLEGYDAGLFELVPAHER